MAASPAPLIWINGFPGCGKLTVARAMAELDDTIIVLDNHKLIDPVEAKFPRTHPDYQPERKLYREWMLEKVACDPSKLCRVLVCTGELMSLHCEQNQAWLTIGRRLDVQSDNELGRSVASDYEAAARRAGRPFYPLYITCDLAVNLGRVASPERLSSGTTKLTDAAVVGGLRERHVMFRFEEYPEWVVDTTTAQPLDVARDVLSKLKALTSSQSRV